MLWRSLWMWVHTCTLQRRSIAPHSKKWDNSYLSPPVPWAQISGCFGFLFYLFIFYGNDTSKLQRNWIKVQVLPILSFYMAVIGIIIKTEFFLFQYIIILIGLCEFHPMNVLQCKWINFLFNLHDIYIQGEKITIN